MEAAIHLTAAFSVTKEFCVELVRQVKLVGMPLEQLDDSINWLIRHHHYPTIQIADVLDYDVKIKLYSYNDVKKLEGGQFDDSTLKRYKYLYTRNEVRYYCKFEDVLMLPDKFRDRALKKIQENEKLKK